MHIPLYYSNNFSLYSLQCIDFFHLKVVYTVLYGIFKHHSSLEGNGLSSAHYMGSVLLSTAQQKIAICETSVSI